MNDSLDFDFVVFDPGQLKIDLLENYIMDLGLDVKSANHKSDKEKGCMDLALILKTDITALCVP